AALPVDHRGAAVAPYREERGVAGLRHELRQRLLGELHRIDAPHGGEPDVQRERPEVVAAVGVLAHEPGAHEACEVAVRAARIELGLRAEILQGERSVGALERLQEPDARVDRLDAAALALAHCTNTNELAYGQYTPIRGGSASPFHGVISALRWLTAPRSSRAATALKYRRARPCCRRDSTPATSCPIAAARASAAP